MTPEDILARKPRVLTQCNAGAVFRNRFSCGRGADPARLGSIG